MDNVECEELEVFVNKLYDQSIDITGHDASEFSRGYMAAASVITSSILGFINKNDNQDDEVVDEI